MRNPIDQFILARLEQGNRSTRTRGRASRLGPAGRAGSHGLPPLPVQVEAFVADKSPEAYENWWIASRRHRSGEHRARCMAGCGALRDTHGIHIDNYREMWLYRDRVIAAFNENQPFDQFTLEQPPGIWLAAGDTGTENCERFQPVQHHHQRGRRD